MRRRGFTMVELIVVISIITILIGLLIVGIGHLHNAAKRQQTQQILANLQGMFGNWDTVVRVPFGASVMPAPMNMSTDVNIINGMTVANDATAGTRYGAAVWLMRDLMFNLKSVPDNAAAIAKLPADEIMTMPTTMNATFPLPYKVQLYATGNSYAPFDATQYGRAYVNDGNNNFTYYECIRADPSTVAVAPPNASYWLPAYPFTPATGSPDNSMPIPLDGWGNPIIFVPGGVLGADPASYNIDAMATNKMVDPGTGGLVVGGSKIQVRSPDGRPFFASAGPDGDFSLGDDNLYSFEH